MKPPKSTFQSPTRQSHVSTLHILVVKIDYNPNTNTDEHEHRSNLRAQTTRALRAKISREAREKFWGEIRSRAKRAKILEENKISRAKRAKILGYFDKSTNLKVNPGIQKQLIKSRPRSGRKFWEFKISADFFLQNLKVIKNPPLPKIWLFS